MCGASSQQTQTYNEQQQFYQQAMQEQSTAWGEDQQLLQQLQSVYGPIFTAGPDQEGFSPEEKAAMETQISDTTAGNYQQATQAVQGQLAARGGGSLYVPSGATAQTLGTIATSAAQEESAQRMQVTQADYEQGYQQWLQAAQGLGMVSNQLNPIGYSQAATGAGSAAGTTANQIAQESNSWINAALGAAGAVGGGLLSNPSLFNGGGSTPAPAFYTNTQVAGAQLGPQTLGQELFSGWE